jgi:hypothetical protein
MDDWLAVEIKMQIFEIYSYSLSASTVTINRLLMELCRSQAAHGITEQKQISMPDIFGCHAAFGHPGSCPEIIPSEDPVQQTAIQRRGQVAVTLSDDNVADRAFGHFTAFIHEQYFLISSPESFAVIPVIDPSVGRFMM